MSIFTKEKLKEMRDFPISKDVKPLLNELEQAQKVIGFYRKNFSELSIIKQMELQSDSIIERYKKARKIIKILSDFVKEAMGNSVVICTDKEDCFHCKGFKEVIKAKEFLDK